VGQLPLNLRMTGTDPESNTQTVGI